VSVDILTKSPVKGVLLVMPFLALFRHCRHVIGLIVGVLVIGLFSDLFHCTRIESEYAIIEISAEVSLTAFFLRALVDKGRSMDLLLIYDT
jgi:hypothetical protein